MPQRKSDCRFGQGCPASLLIAKSAEAEKAGTTQHSPKQRSQSARRLGRCPPEPDEAGERGSGNGQVSWWIGTTRVACSARRHSVVMAWEGGRSAAPVPSAATVAASSHRDGRRGAG